MWTELSDFRQTKIKITKKCVRLGLGSNTLPDGEKWTTKAPPFIGQCQLQCKNLATACFCS